MRLFENTLERIRQSFSLEKDAALLEGPGGLEALREREKSHYRPGLERMDAELRQLRFRIRTMDGLPWAIFARMDQLEAGIKETRAHFTGTVNRLVRAGRQLTGDENVHD